MQYHPQWLVIRKVKKVAGRATTAHGLQVGVLSSLRNSRMVPTNRTCQPLKGKEAISQTIPLYVRLQREVAASVNELPEEQHVLSAPPRLFFSKRGHVDVREHTEHSGTLCTQYCQVGFHRTINYVTQLNCCVFAQQGSAMRVATVFVPMSHVYEFPSIYFLPTIFDFFFIFGTTGRGKRVGCSCATSQMSRLCMWEMCRRRLNSPDWLAGPTPPPSSPSRPVKTWRSQTLGRGLHGNKLPLQEHSLVKIPPFPVPSLPLLPSHCTPALHLSSLFQLDPRLHPLAAFALLFRADTHLASRQKVRAVNLRESSLLSCGERIHLAVFLLEIPDLIVSTENLI